MPQHTNPKQYPLEPKKKKIKTPVLTSDKHCQKSCQRPAYSQETPSASIHSGDNNTEPGGELTKTANHFAPMKTPAKKRQVSSVKATDVMATTAMISDLNSCGHFLSILCRLDRNGAVEWSLRLRLRLWGMPSWSVSSRAVESEQDAVRGVLPDTEEDEEAARSFVLPFMGMDWLGGAGGSRGKRPLDNLDSSSSSRRSMGVERANPTASVRVATELQTSDGRIRISSSDWMTRAGTPTARVEGGMLLVMTLPAPITAPSPMVTPPLFACRLALFQFSPNSSTEKEVNNKRRKNTHKIVTFAPIQTPSPTTIGFPILSCFENLSSAVNACPTLTMQQFGPMLHLSPTTTSATGVSMIIQPLLMKVDAPTRTRRP